MLNAGWIIAGALLVLIVLAAIFRVRLLAAFGLELRAIEPRPAAHEGSAGVPAEREGGTMKLDRLGALFDLHELEVSDVMVHRLHMRSVNADDPPEAVVREILQSPHTRMPLWRGSTDNIVGVLHAKDLLRALNDVGNDFSQIDVMKIAARPWFVPDTTTLQDQLAAFLRRKAHFAIVVDEYGEVEGLVTLEDIIEEIVGEIADEYDADEQPFENLPDGSVRVSSRYPVDDLGDLVGVKIDEDEVDSVGGLMAKLLGKVPIPGSTVELDGLVLQAEEAKGRRKKVGTVLIRPVQAPIEEDAPQEVRSSASP